MRWECYILGPAAENAPVVFDSKQAMLWKLPVIVLTYSFGGCTPGLVVVGAVSCWGCVPSSAWHRENGTDHRSQIRASALPAPVVAARQGGRR